MFYRTKCPNAHVTIMSAVTMKGKNKKEILLQEDVLGSSSQVGQDDGEKTAD